MNAPILLLHPDRGYRPYKLYCRFEIEADHNRGQMEKARNIALNQFIEAMQNQGWQYLARVWPRITGPYPNVQPMNLPKPQRISARQMLQGVMQGNRYRAKDDTAVLTPDPIDQTDWVQYEITAWFTHKTILVDWPDLHEERRWYGK